MVIEKAELMRRIAILEKVLPAKSAIPSTEGILVRDGTMNATNLSIAISAEAPEAGGECFVIPKRGISMIKNLPEGPVNISASGTGLLIKAGKVNAKLSTVQPTDFPDNYSLQDAEETTLDFGILADMLQETVYAVSTDESRPIYTGVKLESDGTELNALGCDGFRIAWARTPYTEAFSMVIPRDTVRLLLSIRGGDKVSIRHVGTKAVFSVGGCRIYSRLLAGSYIDYRRVVPVREQSVGIDRVQLLDAVRRILICSDDTHKCKVDVTGSEFLLRLRCTGPSAEYLEELETQDRFPQDIHAAFNSAFLIDALKSYDCSVIDCFFGAGSTEPLVLDDGSLRSMILPVRIEAAK